MIASTIKIIVMFECSQFNSMNGIYIIILFSPANSQLFVIITKCFQNFAFSL